MKRLIFCDTAVCCNDISADDNAVRSGQSLRYAITKAVRCCR